MKRADGREREANPIRRWSRNTKPAERRAGGPEVAVRDLGFLIRICVPAVNICWFFDGHSKSPLDLCAAYGLAKHRCRRPEYGLGRRLPRRCLMDRDKSGARRVIPQAADQGIFNPL